MKIAIMGAGGVGGFYGGRLAKAGAEVTFIARGPHLEALRTTGLRVESPTVGNFTVEPVNATDDPAAVGPVDLLWMTVKAYGLEAAAGQVRPLVGPETVVVPLLNGVDVAERIGAVLGMEHMMGGVVFVSAAIAEPGLIRHVTMDRLVFGELGGGTSPRGEKIAAMMQQAGIPVELSADIRKEIWGKFVFLATVAGVSAATRSTQEGMVGNPETWAMAEQCMREVEAVARKQGIALEPGITDKNLAFLKSLPGGTKPSMLLDLERGRPLELETLQGAVVKLGHELGVPVPVNESIYATLKPFAGGQG